MRQRDSNDIPDFIYNVKYVPISKEELNVLVTKAKSGCIKSMHRIINSYLRYALKFVHSKQFTSNTHTKSDLFNIAVIGLIEAIYKYDINYENGFIAFAKWYILSRVNRELQVDNLITMPRIWRYIKYHHDEELSINGKIDIDKFCKKYNIPKTRYQRLIKHQAIPVDLNSIIENEDMVDGYDNLSKPDHMVDDIISKNILDQSLSFLKERDKDIICMRFGFPPYDKEHSFRDIGLVHGVTHEAIRQTVKKIVNKIKKRLDYVDLL